MGKRRKREPKVTIEETERVFSDVRCFSKIHWRIREILDVWPTTGKYWSAFDGRRGTFNKVSDLITVIDLLEQSKARNEI